MRLTIKFLIVIAVSALTGLILASLTGCAKDQYGHYNYFGPSIGVNAGYQGISVGVAVAGANPATPIIVAPTPTPHAPSAKDGP